MGREDGWMGLELAPMAEPGMWKELFPETELAVVSRDEDSTDGKGSRSVSGPERWSKGGGVRAFCSGEAV